MKQNNIKESTMENQKMIVTQDMVDSFLQTNKLDFTVEMKPTFIKGANAEASDINIGYCPVRMDTFQPLSRGGLSEGFTPIQNRDAFRVLTQLSGVKDIQLRNGGTWGGGAGVFAQVSLGDMNVGNGGDKVGKYLSVINTHDGSRALNILITPFRYFCMNQIAKSVNEAQKATDRFMSVRHNASADEKLEELIRTVRIADEVFQTTEETYNKMTTMKINEEYVKEVLNRMFPLNPDMGKRGQTIWNNNIEAVKDRFYSADGGRIERDTAWNLYNAVQGTFQHDARNTDTKNRSVLMGDIADKSALALATVLDVCASEHLPESVMSEIDDLTK
jgi:phage/plasmid-like protein (TIGR03299 family)